MRSLYSKRGLEGICKLFGITRQAYYYHIDSKLKQGLVREQILIMVKSVRKIHPRMGTRKIYDLIKPDLDLQGIKLGRDKLFDLMSDNQLLIRNRKRRAITTNSYHHFKKHKNLIKDFRPYKSNQLWVSDITYVRVENRFYYLFLITDAYSHKVVGYKLGETLETRHAMDALKMALKSEENIQGAIHHSDRGIQYCSHKYVKLLQDYKMMISMTEDGNPLDNSIAERINGILKGEYIEHFINNLDYEVCYAIDQAIYRYNQLRPHLSCDMLTPNKAHVKTGKLNRRWKNYYRINQQSIN